MTSEPACLPDFAERVVLITGATGTLGRVASLALARAGAQLILLDKSVPALEKLSDDIVAAGHLMPALYPLDFLSATEEDYESLAGIVDENFGQLHGLLHSAADLGTLQPLGDVSAKAWQTLFLINLTAPFLLTKALLPLLDRSGNASVVFTTDTSARGHKAYWGAYGLTKNALESLALSWAEELESLGRVRINVFAPGPTRSAIRRKTHPGELPDSLPAPDSLAASYVELMHPTSRARSGAVVSPLQPTTC